METGDQDVQWNNRQSVNNLKDIRKRELNAVSKIWIKEKKGWGFFSIVEKVFTYLSNKNIKFGCNHGLWLSIYI